MCLCMYVCMGLAEHSTAKPTVNQAQVRLGWVGSSLALYPILSICLVKGYEGEDFDDGWMARQ